MALVVQRSDIYPVGTVVKAWPLPQHHGLKPSGTAAGEATVGADGKLSVTVSEGLYRLWAEVASAEAACDAGSLGFTAPAAFLGERITANREAVGAI